MNIEPTSVLCNTDFWNNANMTRLRWPASDQCPQVLSIAPAAISILQTLSIDFYHCVPFCGFLILRNSANQKYFKSSYFVTTSSCFLFIAHISLFSVFLLNEASLRKSCCIRRLFRYDVVHICFETSSQKVPPPFRTKPDWRQHAAFWLGEAEKIDGILFIFSSLIYCHLVQLVRCCARRTRVKPPGLACFYF